MLENHTFSNNPGFLKVTIGLIRVICHSIRKYIDTYLQVMASMQEHIFENIDLTNAFDPSLVLPVCS